MSAAGRGMDIKFDDDSLEASGLHVIIPFLMPNQRALEQAAGRSGRQGQPGSVSIYVSPSDRFKLPPQFSPGHDNLTKLELKFSEYLQKTHPWIYNGSGKYGLGELLYSYGATVAEILDITAGRISQMCKRAGPDEEQNALKDLMLDMALIAWGAFFGEMFHHIDDYADQTYCDQQYQDFLKDLSVWLSPSGNTVDKAYGHIRSELAKRINWGDIIVICGITIAATGICVVCPPATPWVIAGGAVAGAVAEGGIEVYRQSKTGVYNWQCIFIKTLGGLFKGAVAASPLRAVVTVTRCWQI